MHFSIFVGNEDGYLEFYRILKLINNDYKLIYNY